MLPNSERSWECGTETLNVILILLEYSLRLSITLVIVLTKAAPHNMYDAIARWAIGQRTYNKY